MAHRESPSVQAPKPGDFFVDDWRVSPGRRADWSPKETGLIMGAAVAVVTLGLLAAGVWLWSAGGGRDIAPASIVVLPFEYFGDDPNQEYLADGMTEDIITDLSRLAGMRVIASNTSLALKGRQVTPEQVGADLDVQFALKGSIRRLGDNLRANAQLVNTKTGFNVWAQRYDRQATELFAVQDELTRSIVEALAVKITSKEQSRLAKRATDDLKAYDYFLEGQRLVKVSSAETNARARGMYRKAIELDPHYGRAYGALAVTLAFDFRRGWTDSPLETLDRALQLANQAVALDDSVPQTYWALGFVHLARKEFDQAEQAAAQAIAIAPNYADGFGLLALIKVFRGDPAKAIELNDQAIRYIPFYSFEYLVAYGMAYYLLGDYDAAIKVLERGQVARTAGLVGHAGSSVTHSRSTAGLAHSLRAGQRPPLLRTIIWDDRSASLCDQCASLFRCLQCAVDSGRPLIDLLDHADSQSHGFN